MNPLDKTFFDGLKDHEIVPSERANKLFEESLKAKEKSNKKPLVYFSMAASILLLLFTGFWLIKDKNQINNSKIAKFSDFKNTNIQKSDDVAVKTSTKIELKSDNVSPSIAFSSTMLSFNEPIKEELINTPKDIVLNQSNDDLKTHGLENNLENSIKSDLLSEVKPETKPEIESIETLVFISPLINSPKIVSNIENLKFVQTTHSDHDYFDEDKSLVTRFLSEVANLKRGEKVDLTKIGFKSLDEISKDDESFIASETKQIKKGYNWIKSKISNN